MAYTPIPPSTGGSGGFGADTIIDLPNSSPPNTVVAVEMVSSLPVSTAGSEFAKWLLELISNGTQVPSYSFEPATLRIDLGNVGQLLHNIMMRYNSADICSIGFDSNGRLILTGKASGTTGGISLRIGSAGGPVGDSAQLAFLSLGGHVMNHAPIQEAQGNNIATASTIAPPFSLTTGGNCFNLTGTTNVNLIDANGWQSGSLVSFRAITGTFNLAHNQAPSGTQLPMINKGATAITMSANGRITYRLMGSNAGAAADGWYDVTGQVV